MCTFKISHHNLPPLKRKKYRDVEAANKNIKKILQKPEPTKIGMRSCHLPCMHVGFQSEHQQVQLHTLWFMQW